MRASASAPAPASTGGLPAHELAAALHAAAAARRARAVARLLAAGAPVGARNAEGRTPLEAAVRAHNMAGAYAAPGARGYARSMPMDVGTDAPGGMSVRGAGTDGAEEDGDAPCLEATLEALRAAGAPPSRFPASDGFHDALPGRLSAYEAGGGADGESGSDSGGSAGGGRCGAARGGRERERSDARGGVSSSSMGMYSAWDEADALAMRLNAARRRRREADDARAGARLGKHAHGEASMSAAVRADASVAGAHALVAMPGVSGVRGVGALRSIESALAAGGVHTSDALASARAAAEDPAELQAFVQSAHAQARSDSSSDSSDSEAVGRGSVVAGRSAASDVAECDGCSKRRWRAGDVYLATAGSRARLCEACAREELAELLAA